MAEATADGAMVTWNQMGYPSGGFLKTGDPQIIHFCWGFVHSKPSIDWDRPDRPLGMPWILRCAEDWVFFPKANPPTEGTSWAIASNGMEWKEF